MPESTKIDIIDNSTVVWRPLPKERPRISALTLYSEKTTVWGLLFGQIHSFQNT